MNISYIRTLGIKINTKDTLKYIILLLFKKLQEYKFKIIHYVQVLNKNSGMDVCSSSSTLSCCRTNIENMVDGYNQNELSFVDISEVVLKFIICQMYNIVDEHKKQLDHYITLLITYHAYSVCNACQKCFKVKYNYQTCGYKNLNYCQHNYCLSCHKKHIVLCVLCQNTKYEYNCLHCYQNHAKYFHGLDNYS